MKKYFIKGTDFELTGWNSLISDSGWGTYTAPNGYRPLVPIDWVEEREVREEPDYPGAVEKDRDGNFWMRNYVGDWTSSDTWYGKSKTLKWAALQEDHGPTRAMKVERAE